MRHRRLRDSNATDTADTASSTASTDSTDSIMSDEEQQTRSRRSSVSSASSASSEQFARDIAVMADKVDAAEALAKLAKDNYLIANQEFKGYSTALNNKLKEQKKLKAQLVARAAQVKAAGDDPQVVEIATAIKNTGRMQGIIQRLKDQEITGEKAIEYIDLAMEQAVIVLESDMGAGCLRSRQGRDGSGAGALRPVQGRSAGARGEEEAGRGEAGPSPQRPDRAHRPGAGRRGFARQQRIADWRRVAVLWHRAGDRPQAAAPQAPCDGRPGQLAGVDKGR